MATAYQTCCVTQYTVEILHEIRGLFEDHFDKGWAATLIVRSGVDTQNVRELRYLVAQQGASYLEREGLDDLLLALRRFLTDLQQCVLPSIRDNLGLRVDVPASWRRRDDFVHRRLLAYVFPHNVERLHTLTDQLAQSIAAA
jgi:hypothetical protein